MNGLKYRFDIHVFHYLSRVKYRAHILTDRLYFESKYTNDYIWPNTYSEAEPIPMSCMSNYIIIFLEKCFQSIFSTDRRKAERNNTNFLI